MATTAQEQEQSDRPQQHERQPAKAHPFLSFADKQLWSRTTFLALYAVVVFNCGALLFGYDTAMFGTLQTTKSFLAQFGTFNGTKNALTTQQQSILNSVNYVGKLVGMVIASITIDKWGYKATVVIACGFQSVGAIIEMTAKSWQVFCVGRTVLYCTVGFIETCVPPYIAEIVLPEYRGLFISLYDVMVQSGQLLASGVVYGISHIESRAGFIIACAIQLIPMLMMFAGVWFTPHSPRWLIQKGREEEAHRVLEKIRPKEDISAGWTRGELVAIQAANDMEAEARRGGWLAVFKGSNRRRTIGPPLSVLRQIACMGFVGNQWTGSLFVNSFAPTLYVRLGLADEAYKYTLAKTALTVISCIIGMAIIDKIGRRTIVIYGTSIEVIFLLILGGLGSIKEPSTGALRMLVASVMLFSLFCQASSNMMGYVIASEVPTLSLRRKTIAVAIFVDIISAWAVSFTSPYLLNPGYANLGPKVGFVWAAFAIAIIVWAVFCLPELKGRSLEEIDELFDANLWAWQFSKYKTTSLAAQVAHHDGDMSLKVQDQFVENVGEGRDEKNV